MVINTNQAIIYKITLVGKLKKLKYYQEHLIKLTSLLFSQAVIYEILELIHLSTY